MFKNIGNIDYFQKNRKSVLSLIGLVLLLGSAVIEKFIPYQEIADTQKISLEEKFKIPPNTVDLRDKLSQIKPRTMSLTATNNGFYFLGQISGYNVEGRVIYKSTGDIYQILGTSISDGSQLGFACICANINGTKTWKGNANTACDAANPNAPLSLNDPIMGTYSIAGVPVPSGSCCKSVPRVGTTNIPGLPTCG